MKNTVLPSLSVVVPVYNSAGSLALLLERLASELPKIAAPFEVILVNDGSRDASWRVATDLVDQYPWVRAIDLMRNYGQHNALLCGIRATRHAIVVTMDDDLQHPPEEIPKLLAKLDEGFDVVYGAPEREEHDPWRRFASSATKSALQSAMGVSTARHVSAFRAFRSHLRAAFSDYQNPYVSVDVLLTWGTVKFTSIAVRHEARAIGASQYTVRKLVTHALNMVTGFTVWPLRFASLIGFAFTLVGAVAMAYVLIVYLMTGGAVPGFTFIASLVALFSGAQLFALGIIGEYLSRMHVRLMGRPAYTIRAYLDTQVGGGALPAPERPTEVREPVGVGRREP